MTTMQTHSQRITAEQYRRLVHHEGARRHRASTASHFVYFLPRRNTWMTARAGQGGVVVRFFARCPCEEQ